MARRQHITLMLVMGVMLFVGMTYFMAGAGRRTDALTPGFGSDTEALKDQGKLDLGGVSSSILTGGSIAPKLENATAKAELGRASWKLFHTMMARFPGAVCRRQSRAQDVHPALRPSIPMRRLCIALPEAPGQIPPADQQSQWRRRMGLLCPQPGQREIEEGNIRLQQDWRLLRLRLWRRGQIGRQEGG